MKPGDKVVILPSFSLSDMRLEALEGTVATVLEVHYAQQQVKGCWVELPKAYLNTTEWYIPIASLSL